MSDRPSLVSRLASSPIGSAMNLLSALIGTLIVEEHAAAIGSAVLRFATLRWSGGLHDPTLGLGACVAISLFLTMRAQRVHHEEQRAQEQRRERAENILLERAETLQQLVESMPPINFLDHYASQSVQAQSALIQAYQDALQPGASREDVGTLVRVVLHIVGKLFALYDNAESAAVGANVMLFVPAGQLGARDAIDFVPDPLGRVELEGALVADRRLSARADLDGPAEDPALPELILPVPRVARLSHGGQLLWQALPGAPQAWCAREVRAYASQEAFLEECERACVTGDGVLLQIQQYFRTRGSAVQSFVSIPLWKPDEERPMGVLNVHSSRPGLLEARDLDRRLLPLLEPLLHALVEMIALMASVPSQTQDGTRVDAPGPRREIEIAPATQES